MFEWRLDYTVGWLKTLRGIEYKADQVVDRIRHRSEASNTDTKE